jgi:hypothetical protein
VWGEAPRQDAEASPPCPADAWPTVSPSPGRPSIGGCGQHTRGGTLREVQRHSIPLSLCGARQGRPVEDRVPQNCVAVSVLGYRWTTCDYELLHWRDRPWSLAHAMGSGDLQVNSQRTGQSYTNHPRRGGCIRYHARCKRRYRFMPELTRTSSPPLVSANGKGGDACVYAPGGVVALRAAVNERHADMPREALG